MRRYKELVPSNAVKLIATTSAADVLRYSSSQKVVIRKLAAHVSGTNAEAVVIKFDKRPTLGSDSGRGDGDMGSISLPASNEQGKIYVDTPASRLTLEPGEEMVAQVTTASCCDKPCIIEVLIDSDAEVDGNFSDVVESA
jgi:hypothetical protein